MLTEHVLSDGRTLEYADLGNPDGDVVVFFHGTPGTAAGAENLVGPAAGDAGFRLLATSRPGYGRTTNSPPGLHSVGVDTVALADSLGVDRFAVHGVSGGGPYALATAAVAGHRVRGVLLGASTGRWAEATPERLSAEDHAVLASGDVARALEVSTAEAEEAFGPLRDLDDPAFAVAAQRIVPPGEVSLSRHPELQRHFLADLHRAVRTADGFARDNVAWGLPWDIDLARVTVPVLVYSGTSDEMVPHAHATWLAARLPGAEVVLLPGADHGTTTLLRLPDQYARLRSVLT